CAKRLTAYRGTTASAGAVSGSWNSATAHWWACLALSPLAAAQQNSGACTLPATCAAAASHGQCWSKRSEYAAVRDGTGSCSAHQNSSSPRSRSIEQPATDSFAKRLRLRRPTRPLAGSCADTISRSGWVVSTLGLDIGPL